MASSTCKAWLARLSAVVMVGAMAALPASAAPSSMGEAAGAKSDAQAKLVEGVELLKDRRFGEALERFQQAYALVPSPLIAYDFGLAYLGLGDSARALESFDTFLGQANDAPADKRRKADRYRDELRALVAVVDVTADVAEAEVAVDGAPLGRVSLPRRLYLRPGSHEVVARADGATHAVTVACTAGQTVNLAVRLTHARVGAGTAPGAPGGAATLTAPGGALTLAAPGGEPRGVEATEMLRQPSPPAPPGRLRAAAVTAVVAGAVSLGAGVVFGVMARNNGAAVTGESRTRADFMPDLEAAGFRDQRLEEVFLSIGAVAVLAGVGLYAMARAHAAHRPPQGAP
jgi:hypothetical protein